MMVAAVMVEVEMAVAERAGGGTGAGALEAADKDAGEVVAGEAEVGGVDHLQTHSPVAECGTAEVDAACLSLVSRTTAAG